ncbi:MAG: ankyrin repeat domain-containing protein [Rickettsiales bacterium]|nr:ankyrin repeat domain-containing protein [Rickettsiales bacterium]
MEANKRGKKKKQTQINPTELLFNACYNADINGVLKAIESGADINAQDKEGKTPLHLATYYNNKEDSHLKIINDLLEEYKNIDINVQDKEGNTPLHYAVTGGNLNTVRILCFYEVDPNIQNTDGKTPLHLATSMPNPEIQKNKYEEEEYEEEEYEEEYSCKENNAYGNIIAKLLERGADKTIEDNFGLTPVDYAKTNEWEKYIYKEELNSSSIPLFIEEGNLPKVEDEDINIHEEEDILQTTNKLSNNELSNLNSASDEFDKKIPQKTYNINQSSSFDDF